MNADRLVTPQDLTKITGYIRGFKIIKTEKHDEAGGYRIVSKHEFHFKGSAYIEKIYPEIYLDRICINDGLDPMFYAFEIGQDTHRFVISSSVLKKLLEDENQEMRGAAQNLLDAIRGLNLDVESAKTRDEYVSLVENYPKTNEHS